MKLLKPIFLVVMVVSLFSCKSDDDNDNQYLLTYENLAGTHSLDFLESEEVQTRIFNDLPSVSTISVVGDTFQVNLIFTEDGNYSIEGQYRITETTVQDGNTVTDTEIILIDEEGTYSIDAIDLTITINPLGLDSQTYNVQLFNENNLRLNYFEEGVIQDGTYEFTEEIRLIR